MFFFKVPFFTAFAFFKEFLPDGSADPFPFDKGFLLPFPVGKGCVFIAFFGPIEATNQKLNPLTKGKTI